MEASPLPKKGAEDVEAESSVNGETAGVMVADTARVLDHAAEVKLCRKFDSRILPCLAVMCTSSITTHPPHEVCGDKKPFVH